MKHIARILIFTLLLSLLSLGGAALAADDYLGVWEYDDYYLWYRFNADGTWEEYVREGLALDGYYEETGSSLQLYVPDGSEWFRMDLDGDVITDSDGDTLFRSELPDFTDNGLADADAVGVWEYIGDDMQAWIQIFEGGRYIMYGKEGAVAQGIARLIDDTTVGLFQSSDDADSDSQLQLTIDGDTAEDEEGEEFERSTLPYDASGEPSGEIPSGYDGLWMYDDYNLSLRIDTAACTYSFYEEEDGSEILSGTLAGTDETGALLLASDKGDPLSVTLQDDGTLVDWEGDTLSSAADGR